MLSKFLNLIQIEKSSNLFFINSNFKKKLLFSFLNFTLSYIRYFSNHNLNKLLSLYLILSMPFFSLIAFKNRSLK